MNFIAHLKTGRRPAAGLLSWLLVLASGSVQAETQTSRQTADVLSQSIAQYEKSVTEREAIGGAYDIQLSEQFVSLATAYNKAGRHSEAEDAFKSALHINRVNNGIYSLSQEPMLRGIIESLHARGLTTEAGDYLGQLNLLHFKAYGEDDPRLLPILEETGLWHLAIYEQTRKLRQDLPHLSAAHSYFDTAITMAARHHATAQQQASLLRLFANTNYQMALHYTRYQSLPEEDLFARQSWSAWEPADTSGRLRYDYYKNGRDALTQTLQFSNDPGQTAQAYADLGDWYFLFGRRNSATEAYQRAHEIVTQSDNTQLAEEIFYSPVILPTFRVRTNDEQQELAWAKVTMDITHKGLATNISVTEHSPASDFTAVENYARENLPHLKFRPRYENGALVTARNVAMTITMPDLPKQQTENTPDNTETSNGIDNTDAQENTHGANHEN